MRDFLVVVRGGTGLLYQSRLAECVNTKDEEPMSARFDVFRLYKDRSVLWLGAVDELAEVKRIVFEQPVDDGSMLTVFDQ